MATFTISTYGQQEVGNPATGSRVKATKVGSGAALLSATYGWPIILPAGGRRSYAYLAIPPEKSKRCYTIEVPEPDWARARSAFASGTREYVEANWRITYTPPAPCVMRATRVVLLSRETPNTWCEVVWDRGSVNCMYQDVGYYDGPQDLQPGAPNEVEQQMAIRREIEELEAAGEAVKTPKPELPEGYEPLAPSSTELFQTPSLANRPPAAQLALF